MGLDFVTHAFVDAAPYARDALNRCSGLCKGHLDLRHDDDAASQKVTARGWTASSRFARAKEGLGTVMNRSGEGLEFDPLLPRWSAVLAPGERAACRDHEWVLRLPDSAVASS